MENRTTDQELYTYCRSGRVPAGVGGLGTRPSLRALEIDSVLEEAAK